MSDLASLNPEAPVGLQMAGPESSGNSLLRRWRGPLTEELRLAPGGFGLGRVPVRLLPEAMARSVCGFCSTGCALDIHLQAGGAVNLSPAPDYPVNLGMACPKGWEALACLSAADRATTPLIRQSDGSMRSASWDEAMRLLVARFSHIMAQHGPESVAFLSTGQICTEEMMWLGALWKFGMGALHGDSNTRQCMATTHVAYKQSFGFDAPPFSYADLEASDVLIFIGANPCIAHPILWQRVLRNRNHPRIVVVDPRRTETAMNATEHLALRPKSDLTLLYGVANLLIQNEWVDREFLERHTTGYADFREFVRPFTPERTAEETGLTRGQVHRFAKTIHSGRAVSFWWTMGVNQSHQSTRTAQAIINLALLTGNIGRPGTGPNSITGQCNAMGSRLFANITGLPGGRDFANAADRAEVARILEIPKERISPKRSWSYEQIMDGVRAGKIRGLWVIATNPAHSWGAGLSRVLPVGAGGAGAGASVGSAELLSRLDFLVVQDMFATTDTARLAHLLLPAAGWGEKEGTLINSERRIGLVRKVRRPPGLALSDFNIFRLVAHYWGCGGLFAAWRSPEAVFQILKRLSAGRPCDFTGIRDYRHLEQCGGIQWPFPDDKEGRPPGVRPGEPADGRTAPACPLPERRLFEDGQFFTADGKARLLFEAPRAVAEPPDEEYPFILLTGRGTSAQWHTNTRTSKSAVLRALYPPGPYVEIHPDDAARLGIGAQSSVAVISRRARVAVTAFITAAVAPGQVFMPMHYDVTNLLTRTEYDPYSRQPSYKYCAVRLERTSPPGNRPPSAGAAFGGGAADQSTVVAHTS